MLRLFFKNKTKPQTKPIKALFLNNSFHMEFQYILSCEASQTNFQLWV